MNTMTLWGAYAKLEAIARAAEVLGLPGRVEIREHVERLLIRNELPAADLAAAAADWRETLGWYPPRTAAWLDEALFRLQEYLELPEILLSGAELLDHLIDGSGDAELDEHVADAASNHHLVSLY